MKWIILFYGQSTDGVGELVTAVKTGEDIDYQNYLLLTIPNKHLINSILCVPLYKPPQEYFCYKALLWKIIFVLLHPN